MSGILVVSFLLAACGGGESGSSSSETDAAPQDADVASSGPVAQELGSIDAWYNGEPTTLGELQGSPVLLIFWADF